MPNEEWKAVVRVALGMVPSFDPILSSLRGYEKAGMGTLRITAAGDTVFYDPAVLARWGVEVTAAVLVHEIMHFLRERVRRSEKQRARTPE